MSAPWLLARNGQWRGPYSTDQLRELAVAGELLPEDILLQEGERDWVLAKSLPDLFPSENTAIQSPPLPWEKPKIETFQPAMNDVYREPAWEDDGQHSPPALWNPNAAAMWSLVFTPIFGAYLHASNWRVLGKPSRATANFIWLGVTVIFLAANVGTLFLPDSKALDALMRVGGIGLLLGWYFSQGKAQAQYIDMMFPDGYVRKGWAAPLGVAFAITIGFLAGVFMLAIITDEIDPKDLANDVKPLILEESRRSAGVEECNDQEDRTVS